MNVDRPDLQHDLPGPPAAAWAIVPDLFCATAGYILAYRLRFDAEVFANFFASGLRLLPVVAGCQMAALIAAGIYRKGGRYRLASRLILAVAAGTGIAMAVTWRFFGFEGISRMAFLVAGALFAAAAMTWRGAFVLWR